MDKLRFSLIRTGYNIKFTSEESKNMISIPSTNTSWLMQDRGNLHYTHPEYRGPFTEVNVFEFHLYCSLEIWEALGNLPEDHWDYRRSNGRNSYNPAEPMNQCHMYLSIIQRKRIWRISSLAREIFDDLNPKYFFDKID